MEDSKIPKTALTVDIDWASDAVIEYTAAILVEHQIKTTWFITHDSPAVRKLFECKSLFEIGIHPNFLPDSTQGKTVEEVIDYLLNIHPEAQIMRTHSLYQSSLMFASILEKYPQIRLDVSLFLPHEKNVLVHKLHINPDFKERYIYRIPYIWEDDIEMLLPDSDFKFDINNFLGDGLKIFDFHPIHIALNTRNLTNYEKFKKSCSISNASLMDVQKFRESDLRGTENFLMDILNSKNIQFVHLKELF